MSEIQEVLKEIEEQENTLQFTEFNSESAMKLGLIIIEKAISENKIVTIDITKNGHQLFHYAFEGTSPDNDQWIIRKNRVVNRFNHSSFYIGNKLKQINETLEQKYFVSSFEYSPHGGAFPIIIKNTGVIGTISVSGLPQEEDHKLVVECIREYLKST